MKKAEIKHLQELIHDWLAFSKECPHFHHSLCKKSKNHCNMYTCPGGTEPRNVAIGNMLKKKSRRLCKDSCSLCEEYAYTHLSVCTNKCSERYGLVLSNISKVCANVNRIQES